MWVVGQWMLLKGGLNWQKLTKTENQSQAISLILLSS